MALTLWIELAMSEIEIKEIDVTQIYGTIEKKYLSFAYDVEQYSLLYANLIEILENNTYYSLNPKLSVYLDDLKTELLEFYLVRMKLGRDRLYISNKTWIRFRDFGILPGAKIKIKISSAIKNGKIIDIYPRRDLVI